MTPSAVLQRVAPPLVRAALILGIHLLAVGHDLPGGGFAGALMIGVGVGLSVLARRPLPRGFGRPRTWLGAGLLAVTLVGVLPAVIGATPLDMTWLDVDLGVLGSYKLTSALLFDLGVAAVVIGLVVTIVQAFDDGATT